MPGADSGMLGLLGASSQEDHAAGQHQVFSSHPNLLQTCTHGIHRCQVSASPRRTDAGCWGAVQY